MKEDWKYKRGDIYLANLNPTIGSEQGGVRPVLVIQNDLGNLHCPTLIIAPITSYIKKMTQPTHYLLEHTTGLTETSVALLEQIRTIDKQRIIEYRGKVSHGQMEGIEKAILVSLDVGHYG